jgi:hypothetical protein
MLARGWRAADHGGVDDGELAGQGAEVFVRHHLRGPSL